MTLLFRRMLAYGIDVAVLAVYVQLSQFGLRFVTGDRLWRLTDGWQIEALVLLTWELNHGTTPLPQGSGFTGTSSYG